jgi:hypothetical protein
MWSTQSTSARGATATGDSSIATSTVVVVHLTDEQRRRIATNTAAAEAKLREQVRRPRVRAAAQR